MLRPIERRREEMAGPKATDSILLASSATRAWRNRSASRASASARTVSWRRLSLLHADRRAARWRDLGGTRGRFCGSDAPVSSRARYIATCLGKATSVVRHCAMRSSRRRPNASATTRCSVIRAVLSCSEAALVGRGVGRAPAFRMGLGSAGVPSTIRASTASRLAIVLGLGRRGLSVRLI
jgi:hypothetical protein